VIFYRGFLNELSIEIALDKELMDELNAQSKRDFEEKSMYDSLMAELAFEKELTEYNRLHEEISGQDYSLGM
jgi:hypothetical protein